MNRPDVRWLPWSLPCPDSQHFPSGPRQVSGCFPRIALSFKAPGGILADGLGCPQLGRGRAQRAVAHGSKEGSVSAFTPRVLPLEGTRPAPLTQDQDPTLLRRLCQALI